MHFCVSKLAKLSLKYNKIEQYSNLFNHFSKLGCIFEYLKNEIVHFGITQILYSFHHFHTLNNQEIILCKTNNKFLLNSSFPLK